MCDVAPDSDENDETEISESEQENLLADFDDEPEVNENNTHDERNQANASDSIRTVANELFMTPVECPPTVRRKRDHNEGLNVLRLCAGKEITTKVGYSLMIMSAMN